MAGLMTTIPEELIPRQSRFRGCLLGGAVGDALGAPVEFMSRAQIESAFGPGGIREFAPAYGGCGRITDDTQMTLFTADGLIRAWVASHHTEWYVHVPSEVKAAYLRWLLTQGFEPRHEPMPREQSLGWLYGHPELHHARAPGNTCLSSLIEMGEGELRADNNSKGCGGVMRVAPVALAAMAGSEFPRTEWASDRAYEIAAITHGHPSGKIAASALALLVILAAKNEDLRVAARPVLFAYLTEYGEEANETMRAVDLALSLAESDIDRQTAIAQLGEGWVAEEALAMSFYCALVARDFRDGVTLAVNHDGDSDSTGAITGNILGAKWGVEAIPPTWLGQLEIRDVITEIADDLLTHRGWPITAANRDVAFDERARVKYPPS